jgi:hypothetical protein
MDLQPIFQQTAHFIDQYRYPVVGISTALAYFALSIMPNEEKKSEDHPALKYITAKNAFLSFATLGTSTFLVFWGIDLYKLEALATKVSYNATLPSHIQDIQNRFVRQLDSAFLSDLRKNIAQIKLASFNEEKAGSVLQLADDKNMFFINLSHEFDVSKKEAYALWKEAKDRNFEKGFYQIKNMNLATGALTVDFQTLCDQAPQAQQTQKPNPCVLPLSLSQ